MRQNIGGSSPWEAVVGSSRAVRVGNVVQVAALTDPRHLVEIEAEAMVPEEA